MSTYNVEIVLKEFYDSFATDNHTVVTPIALCKEVLSKVKTKENILVIANIEWLFVLNSKVLKNTTFVSPCENKIMLVRKKFPQIKVIHGNILEMDFDMKFDVVIGNPPFQDASRKDQASKLWPQIVQKSWDLVTPYGIMAMITPDGWKSPSADIGKGSSGFSIYRDIFKKNNVIAICYDSHYIGKKYFKGVGSSFSWYVVQKSTSNSKTKMISADNFIELDLTQFDYLPREINPITLSINQKMISQKHFDFIDQNSGNHGSESKHYSEKHRFKNYHTPAKGGTFVYSDQKDIYSDNIKVMISLSGTWKPVIDHGTIGAGYFCVSKLVDTTHHAQNLQSILSSNLFSFYVRINTYSGFLPRVCILNLPYVDFSRGWTDQELYEHFDLTQEEIDYIEQTIK